MEVVDTIMGVVIFIAMIFWVIRYTYRKGYDRGYSHGTMTENLRLREIFWNEQN